MSALSECAALPRSPCFDVDPQFGRRVSLAAEMSGGELRQGRAVLTRQLGPSLAPAWQAALRPLRALCRLRARSCCQLATAYLALVLCC